MCDNGCICKGNWRDIVKETEPLFGQYFDHGFEGLINTDNDGPYLLVGVLNAEDDYYYCFRSQTGRMVLASCVGSLETNGFTPVAP